MNNCKACDSHNICKNDELVTCFCGNRRLRIPIYIYIYIYIYMLAHIYIYTLYTNRYIYIYIYITLCTFAKSPLDAGSAAEPWSRLPASPREAAMDGTSGTSASPCWRRSTAQRRHMACSNGKSNAHMAMGHKSTFAITQGNRE